VCTDLRDLIREKVEVIPTVFIERSEVKQTESGDDCAAFLRAFVAKHSSWSTIVLKPTVSADAYMTVKAQVSNSSDMKKAAKALEEILYKHGDSAMVQPFVPEIITTGELSLCFVDGAFSHAVRKLPAKTAGEFRTQTGSRADITPSEAQLAFAKAAWEAAVRSVKWEAEGKSATPPAQRVPLYARVDFVTTAEHTPSAAAADTAAVGVKESKEASSAPRPLLMVRDCCCWIMSLPTLLCRQELELCEPLMYLYGDARADAFAAAVLNRLAAHKPQQAASKASAGAAAGAGAESKSA
jgi:hypothetical protein